MVSALDWATAEASAQGRPLRIVHAIRADLAIDPHGGWTVTRGPDQPNRPVPYGVPAHALRQADRIVTAAMNRALSIAPDLAVSADVVAGAPLAVLRRESRRARLLVVGQCGHHHTPWPHRFFGGSMPVRLATRAHCPVVVAAPDAPENAVRIRATPRVLVEVDLSHPCDRGIAMAFRAARQRGIGLTALHVTNTRGPRRDPELDRLLASAVSRWHARYPEVALTTEVRRGRRCDIVPTHSVGAALLVVTARQRPLPGASLRRAERLILRHTRCPVAMVCAT